MIRDGSRIFIQQALNQQQLSTMNLNHHHAHVPRHFNRAFALGVILNTGYALAEAGAGWWFHSVALLADAGHNLTDVAALLLSWGAFYLSTRPPSPRHTYGRQRLTILASLISGVLLFGAVIVIAWEAWHRLGQPQVPMSFAMVTVALIGVGVNIGTAWLFHSGSQHDLNLRGAWLHMLADAGVSAAVVVAGVVIHFTAWLWLDPILAMLIAVVILLATWGLLMEALDMASDAVPRKINAAAVAHYLRSLPGVQAVHDLHIWPLSTTETALTAHLVMPEPPASDRFLFEVADNLRHQHGIDHPTLQVERGDIEHPDHGWCDRNQ